MTADQLSSISDKGYLIRHAVGSGLQGFLPGQNHQAAIAQRSGGMWADGEGVGTITKAGVCWWPTLNGSRTEKPTYVLPWRDVLDVIRKGSGDGNRERYEEAWQAWADRNEEPLPHPRTPDMSNDEYFGSEANQHHWDEGTRTHRDKNRAAEAIISAGLERSVEMEQAVLF